MPTRVVPITKDHEWFSGTDRTFRFTTSDSAGTAVDITGWALSWELYEENAPPGATALFAKTTGGGGITLTTPASGIADVAVADTDTDNLKGDRNYYYEFRRTDAGFEDVLACGPAWLRSSPKR